MSNDLMYNFNIQLKTRCGCTQEFTAASAKPPGEVVVLLEARTVALAAGGGSMMKSQQSELRRFRLTREDGLDIYYEEI